MNRAGRTGAAAARHAAGLGRRAFAGAGCGGRL